MHTIEIVSLTLLIKPTSILDDSRQVFSEKCRLEQ